MRIKFIIMALLGISLLFPLNVFATASQTVEARPFQQAEIIPGELVVGMKPGMTMRALSLPENSRLAKTSPGLNKLNAGVIIVPPGEESQYIAKIQKTRGVLFVEPNYRVSASIIPDDTHWVQQYGPSQIQAPAAWDITTGSSSVILAIIDSGLDVNHPEFNGRIVAGYDFVEDDTVPQDGCGHGTHVAGIAAARGNNADGIAGLAWDASIMPVRVLGPTCSGSTADVAEALVWAVERGAKVINLSLGTLSSSTLMENGTYYAYTHGAAIFAAAGNSGNSLTTYPAAYAWVMSVGATNSFGLRAGYSNTGTALDLMAPGDAIYSTLPMQAGFFYNLNGKATQYDSLSGTSMASAHAAGAAALLASLSAFNTPDKIYQTLTSTALDMDAVGRDDNTGYGLIQLANALAFTPAIVPTPVPSFAVDYDLVNSVSCNNLVQYNWRDATSGTAQLFLPGSNSGYAQVNPLPFNFNLGSQTYTSITAHSNGYISMGINNTDTTEGNFANNFLIPGIAKPNNFIAPFWDDLTSQTNGVLFTTTLGSAPNREFVIEYTQMQRVGFSSGLLQFEVVLFEGSNEILMQYHTLTGAGSDGSSATVGLEYEDGLAGHEYSYNKSGALTKNFALLFIPFPSGGIPPSNSCSTFTTPVDDTGGFYDAPPFCVLIPQDALQHPATLQIRPVVSAPAMRSSFLDLRHYTDITLAYSPAPPLSPMPEVYVCYHYTAQDTLAAGGHPKNLFITAYDATDKKWEALSTSVDSGQGLLVARAPHFSFYGVATLNTTASANLNLPVTGTVISREFAVFLIGLGLVIIFLLSRTWSRKKHSCPAKSG